MKSKPKLIALFVLLPILLGFSGAVDKVVIIRPGDRTGLYELTDYQIKALFKGNDWVLATASAGEILRAKKDGFGVEIVDETPWSNSYFFVSTPERGFPPDIPSAFRMLADLPDGIVIEGPDSDARTLFERNPWVMRIEDRAIPLTGKKSGRFAGISHLREDPMDFMDVQISDSTITEYVTRLADYRTRLCCTDSNTASAAWILDKFEEFGYTEVYYDTFPFPAPGYPCDTQINVIAVKPGTIDPDRVIVFGGHYDSITYSPQICSTDTLAPGADDNASGTVAVLEAARLLFDLDTDVTIMFVAFGSEEQGLYGAGALAQQMYNEGTDIKLMINADMVGNYVEDGWDFDVWTTGASRPFAAVFTEMAVTYTNLIPHNVFASLADASPFDQLGFFNVGLAELNIPGNPQWHSCSDELEYMSIPYMADVVEVALRSILYVSNAPTAPTGLTAMNIGEGTSLSLTWVPNDESDVIGYNIYYGTESGVYDSLKTVSLTADTLTNLPEGVAFYIALTALDGEGYESFLTDEVEIVTSAVPAPPAHPATVAYDDFIRLTWEPNTGELDISGYSIYRFAAEGTTDTVHVGSVFHPEDHFSDTSVEAHVLYTYYVTAFDTEVPPNESSPSEECVSRLASHDMGILIIDNTTDGTGGPFSPTDEQVDTYYDNLLSHYAVSAHWDTADSAAAGRPVMDYDVGVFSSVIWYSDVRSGVSAAPDTLTMKKYLEGGGNLWLTGWNLLQTMTGSTGPRYRFTPGDFFSSYAGIDSALTTLSSERDFIGAGSMETGFSDVSVDTGKTFPIYALYDMDVFLPPFQGAVPLYSYVSSDSLGSPYHGLPVAVAHELSSGSFVFTAFPLYFMIYTDALSLTEAVMELFLEPSSLEPVDVATLPKVYSVSQNYPNPFNPTTSIRYNIPDHVDDGVKVRIRIFNIRGKLVKTLLDEFAGPGSYSVTWDGRDERGNTMGSGVYFYHIKAGDFTSTRKMILTK